MLEQIRKDPQTLAAFARTVSGAQVVGPDPVKQARHGLPLLPGRQLRRRPRASAGWVKLWVGADGLPIKLESDSSARVLGMGSQSRTTILYEGYGAPVRIVAPI